MKARDAKGALSADLLVCFPSRTSLTLRPKSICSPARSLEAKKHHDNNSMQLIKRGRTKSFGQASPMLWAKTKAMSSEISEPTSPKVTCAGQIKVRHKTGSIKSWQSVMEEIERIHKHKKQKKRKPSWAEALGFKKDVMHFLTCLRRIRFDLRCFGSFPQPDITSDDEEEEEEDREENHAGIEGSSEGTDENSRAFFSKWYMVLQENQSDDFSKQDSVKRDDRPSFEDDGSTSAVASVSPPNALLLMRCRSAPAKSWLEEKEEEEENDHEEEEECREENVSEKQDRRGKITLKSLMDQEKMRKMNENLVVMTYGSDLYNISTEIAKETWVVSGMKDPISRSRSWKR
ncbi:uncharacterized protein LOC126795233 [Argentina anserina]|uniref:uncharacterized protein LOC126795233 n=1 Tax=Argentina anserina TaxID=57926 RepID=UPI0021764D38|nr:uncharacterized protein LOC126795233 [Potentilla anserina]